MKTIKKLSILLLLAALTSCYGGRTLVNANNGGQISFQTFYNELSPYGDWVEDYELGYMWVPQVHRNFHPYASDGYWTMTNYGNTWVSNYSWGWAPFHYGRWLYDDYVGWAWVPGYEWAPAWVSWRSGSGYYGWAPMGPRMRMNTFMDIPYSHFVFLPQRYMYQSSMDRYYNNRRRNVNIYHQTNIINNTNIYNNNTYYSGPSSRDYERETGRQVSVRNVTNSGRAGRTTVDNRSVSIYRPEVNRGSGSNERPSSVTNRSSVDRTQSSGRVTNAPNRGSNVERNTNANPETRRNSTVNRSTESQSTRNRGEAVNRSTESQSTRNSSREAVNRSTQEQQQTTRNKEAVNRSTPPPASTSISREAENRNQNSSRSSSSTQRSSENVNAQRATNQNVRSTTDRSAASSTAPTRSSSVASSSSSRSSSVSSAPARSATARTSSEKTEEASTSRSSSTRTGRTR